MRPLEPAVADALDAQNRRVAPSPARDVHLAALRTGAAAVVTGQQVGLFLGPLFTVYKAATAIRVARALADASGRPVVPVFWLQTEDHDLPEIATSHVPCASDVPRALRVPSSPDDRVSIAHRRLPDDVAACLAELGIQLGHLPNAAAHLERLARHYRPGRTWGDAFAGVLSELFAPEGLVLVDPRDPALGAPAAAVHRHALTHAASIASALESRSDALRAAGFAPAVHVRPGAPLSFFHPDGAEGPRHRLAPAGDDFALVGRDDRCARTALLATLDAEPLRFSTSALLRPILQDTLLPTAAYVGGPSELAYYAQLAPLYEAFALPMPLVVPRARLRIVDAGTARTLARLGITADDAGRPEAELLAVAGDAGIDPDALAERVLGPFADGLDALRAELAPLAPGVDTAFDKTRATVATSVKKLTGKIADARRHADRDTTAAIRRVQQALWPHGEPQERVYGLPWFAARFGERPFLERTLAEAEPFAAAPRDVVWPSEERRP